MMSPIATTPAVTVVDLIGASRELERAGDTGAALRRAMVALDLARQAGDATARRKRASFGDGAARLGQYTTAESLLIRRWLLPGHFSPERAERCFFRVSALVRPMICRS